MTRSLKSSDGSGAKRFRMQLKFEQLGLVGATELQFGFTSGMNVISGPIGSGKTSLWRLMRFALGTRRPSVVPPEVASFVKSVSGQIELDAGRAHILRPFVTTDTALVNVDLDGRSDVLPARESTSLSDETFDGWMLKQLGLPSVQVRQRRSDPESPLIPLSLADFLEWCFLEQDVLETGLFNAADFYTESKRRYVFEYVYGLADLELASAEAELSEVLTQLGTLQHRHGIIKDFLDRAGVAAREDVSRRIGSIDAEREQLLGLQPRLDGSVDREVRQSVQLLDGQLSALDQEVRSETKAVEDLGSLAAQLRTQVARLNRAILAGTALVDFEFVDCPRCGQALPSRDVSQCVLCGQSEVRTVDTSQLRQEQRRLESQLEETRSLIDARRALVVELGRRQESTRGKRVELARRLDELTLRYVSDRQTALETQARRLGELDAERLRYLELERMYGGLEAFAESHRRLQERANVLRALIDEKRAARRSRQGVLDELAAIMAEVLDRLGVAPLQGQMRDVVFDTSTYQPRVEGRFFESLSSAGLRVVFNLAHAVTHHIYAGRHHESPLPRLLVIDGPRKNLGTLGYDVSVGDEIYRVLINLAELPEMDTQIVVFDNGFPDFAAPYVRRSFDLQHRLIPVTNIQQSF